MYPRAPSAGIHGGATGTESTEGVEVRDAITRSGVARFDSAGENPALGRWVATDRREQGPRSRKPSWERPQQGVCASDTTRRLFGTTPSGSPRVGLFSTSAHFQAEITRSNSAPTFSFVVPAGTKCGATSQRSKQSRSETNTRAGPASAKTTGLAERLQLGLESDDARHKPPYVNPSQEFKVVRSGSPPPILTDTEVSCVGTQ